MCRALDALAHDLRGPAGAVTLAAGVLATTRDRMTAEDLGVVVTTLERAAARLQVLAARAQDLAEGR